MTQVTLELDEETFARVTEIASARRISVEDLLRRQVENVAKLTQASIDPLLQQERIEAIVRALERGDVEGALRAVGIDPDLLISPIKRSGHEDLKSRESDVAPSQVGASDQDARHSDVEAENRRRLLELIDNSPGRAGPNWTWNREDAYEDRVFPRHQHSSLRGSGTKR
jgi:predicted transcriptional regulator